MTTPGIKPMKKGDSGDMLPPGSVLSQGTYQVPGYGRNYTIDIATGKEVSPVSSYVSGDYYTGPYGSFPTRPTAGRQVVASGAPRPMQTPYGTMIGSPYGSARYTPQNVGGYVISPYGAMPEASVYGPDGKITGGGGGTGSQTGGSGAGRGPGSGLSSTAGSILPALDPQTQYELNKLGIDLNREYGLGMVGNRSTYRASSAQLANALRQALANLSGRGVDLGSSMAESGIYGNVSPALGALSRLANQMDMARARTSAAGQLASARETRAMADEEAYRKLVEGLIDLDTRRTAARAQLGAQESGGVAKPTKKPKGGKK